MTRLILTPIDSSQNNLFWQKLRAFEFEQALIPLGAGADPNASDPQGSALSPLLWMLTHLRSHRDDICGPTLLLFLISGAQLNVQDEKGQTPLMLAIHQGDPQVVRIITENKHNQVTTYDKNGFNIFDHLEQALEQQEINQKIYHQMRVFLEKASLDANLISTPIQHPHKRL